MSHHIRLMLILIASLLLLFQATSCNGDLNSSGLDGSSDSSIPSSPEVHPTISKSLARMAKSVEIDSLSSAGEFCNVSLRHSHVSSNEEAIDHYLIEDALRSWMGYYWLEPGQYYTEYDLTLDEFSVSGAGLSVISNDVLSGYARMFNVNGELVAEMVVEDFATDDYNLLSNVNRADGKFPIEVIVEDETVPLDQLVGDIYSLLIHYKDNPDAEPIDGTEAYSRLVKPPYAVALAFVTEIMIEKKGGGFFPIEGIVYVDRIPDIESGENIPLGLLLYPLTDEMTELHICLEVTNYAINAVEVVPITYEVKSIQTDGKNVNIGDLGPDEIDDLDYCVEQLVPKVYSSIL